MQLPTTGGPDGATGPYGSSAHTYRAAGWAGVLPLPPGRKKDPPTGWTGHAGQWPSGADIEAWVEDHPGGNIALRLPPDVIGIDVDAYPGKIGAATFANALREWGQLPPTWTSTARSDGISGIRLYRVPEGLRWPGQLGPAVEIIQYAHRYVVVAPSTNPDAAGARYRWTTPDGTTSLSPPQVDDIPDLPETWIVGLTGGVMAEEVNLADLTQTEAGTVLEQFNHPGAPCGAMATTRDRLLTQLREGGSAHESLRRLLGLVRLAERGHLGLNEALTQVHKAFIAETTRPGRAGETRDPETAQAEWNRSLVGAVRRVKGSPTTPEAEETPPDPCSHPFVGLIAQPVTPTPKTPPAGNDTPSGSGPANQQPPQNPDITRTSWWPRDLTPVISGNNPDPEPAILRRDDKQALLYSGKVNALLGESESGKTWVALLGVAQEITAGNGVLYLDFEDTATTIVSRLQALGVTNEELANLTYLEPDEALHAAASADLAELLETRANTLIVVDGVNSAMALLGLESNSTTDTTLFAQKLCTPLAKTGAAVLTIDHIGKNKDTRGKGGIGSQAKRAMITGCALLVDVTQPFGRGGTGKLKLTVDKDRPGHVRGLAAYSKNIGTAVLTSNGETGTVTVSIAAASEQTATGDSPPWRPTHLMERVSRYLANTVGGASGKAIRAEIPGKDEIIVQAANALVESGHVRREGAGPSSRYVHVALYREADDLVADRDEN